jgi:hypothetical protein
MKVQPYTELELSRKSTLRSPTPPNSKVDKRTPNTSEIKRKKKFHNLTPNATASTPLTNKRWEQHLFNTLIICPRFLVFRDVSD